MNEKHSLDEWFRHWLTLHDVGIDLGLSRIRAVWQRLGSPALASRHVITVAGTNGKGSCVHMLARILAKKGNRVATFTSPHILEYNERIQFFHDDDVSMVSDSILINAFDRIERARGEITISYFEVSALAAFLCFAERDLDVVILEVGLGGRLDAVNIIDADATLITSIGIDHEAYLGNNINDIAREKAGVMRAGKLSVYASSTMPAAIKEEATRIGATLLVQGRDFTVSENKKDAEQAQLAVYIGGLTFILPERFVRLGRHQLENASGVLALLVALNEVVATDASLIAKTLSQFTLAGRFEIISTEPLIVLDVAHNEDSIRALNVALDKYPCTGKRVAVVGMLVDKAHHLVFTHLSNTFDCWHLATLSGERGFTADQLRERLIDVSPNARLTTHPTVADALEAAQTTLTDADQLIIFGSFVTVEQAKRYFKA